MTIKECPNCPGATDHTAADCPIKPAWSVDTDGILRNAQGEWAAELLAWDKEKLEAMLEGEAQPQPSAAQSAPDEREAFEAWAPVTTALLPNGRDYISPTARLCWETWQAAAAWQRAQSAPDDSHSFKNFHRLLCERFGYTHDEKDWRRDQLSLIEHIAAQSAPELGPDGSADRYFYERGFEAGKRSAQSAPVVPEYTSAMGEAAQQYIDECCRGSDGQLLIVPPRMPGSFYWYELFARMLAAPQPAARQEQGDDAAHRGACPHTTAINAKCRECRSASAEGKNHG